MQIIDALIHVTLWTLFFACCVPFIETAAFVAEPIIDAVLPLPQAPEQKALPGIVSLPALPPVPAIEIDLGPEFSDDAMIATIAAAVEQPGPTLTVEMDEEPIEYDTSLETRGLDWLKHHAATEFGLTPEDVKPFGNRRYKKTWIAAIASQQKGVSITV